MASTNLEIQTQRYWKVTNCWYRKRGSMTVEQANKELWHIRQRTNPQSHLRRLMETLSMDIIMHQHTPASVHTQLDELETEAE